jgi:hypothetical protein
MRVSIPDLKFAARMVAPAAVAVLALFASDAGAVQKWGPTWSEVTGILFSRTQLNREGAVIARVDGKSQTARIVKTEPGRRTVVVRSPMRKGFKGSDVTLDLDLQACRRYYVNAQFKAGSGPDWEPVIAMVEPIAGCKAPA